MPCLYIAMTVNKDPGRVYSPFTVVTYQITSRFESHTLQKRT